jgi:hypothetical protein
LCEEAGIEPGEFTSAVIGLALSCGVDMSAVLESIIAGPERIEVLIALALESGGVKNRVRFLEEMADVCGVGYFKPTTGKEIRVLYSTL